MQLHKDRIKFVFLKDSKLPLFLIPTCSIHGGSIAKRVFPKVFAFYQGYNKVHLVINSQLSLVFPTSNKVINRLWCNGMVGFIGCNQDFIHNSLLDI